MPSIALLTAYAIEAIKQGSAAVGLVSKTHVVLAALKRNAEELGSYQKKIIKVDDHMGVALAGLAPDARILSNYLRQQAMSSKMVFNRPLSLSKAVHSIADKAQENTQSAGGRPYGVGLLVAGYDDSGAHLYEFLPSGSVLEYVGAAIGARSQAAKTFMERKLEDFPDASKEQLIEYALTALRDTLAQDKELNSANTTVAVVGVDQDFTVYDDDDVEPWLNLLDSLANTRNTALKEEDDDEDDDDNDGDKAASAEGQTATAPAAGAGDSSDSGTQPSAESESMDVDP
ncbi:proteasome [Pichia membranifaciens]|uniref:Proteasome n=1 Tax=Pichia membranifaciens TaxID=4926 RepID=A0A1Q2YLH2_9ASCO|nr:proteasome [Pichia membranifaciens]